MAGVKVDTKSLTTKAQTILGEANAFKSSFDALYAKIDELKNVYTGEDGVQYINKINGYKDEFITMFDKLKQTAGAFESVAEAYEKTVRANM